MAGSPDRDKLSENSSLFPQITEAHIRAGLSISMGQPVPPDVQEVIRDYGFDGSTAASVIENWNKLTQRGYAEASGMCSTVLSLLAQGMAIDVAHKHPDLNTSKAQARFINSILQTLANDF